jgi:hypothetical protein
MDGWMDGWTDGRTDGRTDGCCVWDPEVMEERIISEIKESKNNYIYLNPRQNNSVSKELVPPPGRKERKTHPPLLLRVGPC